MTARRSPWLLLASTATAAIAALVTGCGDQRSAIEPSSEPQPTASPPDASQAPPPTTATPTTAAATATATATASDLPLSRKASTALLTAAQLRTDPADYAWRTLATSKAEGDDLAGTCHKFALTSIGATKVQRRDFTATDPADPSAVEAVASFPDSKTAKRAYAVLLSWHDHCAATLAEHPDLQVHDVSPVGAGADAAGWYLLSYDGVADAQGLARLGARIVTLGVRATVEDYDYPAGQEPIAIALGRAVAKVAG